MNTVYVLAPGENWIVDRFVKEWNEDNADISCSDPTKADIIWLLADWCFQHLGTNFLKSKKVITTIHHIVPEKFGQAQLHEFTVRDQITTVYHVPNKYTESFIRSLTHKPINVIPYWANNRIWKKTCDQRVLMKKHGLPEHGYFIGSFQRDTEGSDLVSPKLEKGPDLFIDFIVHLWKRWETEIETWGPVCGTPLFCRPHVVLAGWRRQYVIKKLEQESIPYTYFELPSQETVNELYQVLDLYPVTSRYEGGPQSLIECGLLGIKCVSRPVGIADTVLPSSAVNDDVKLAIPAIPNVETLKLPAGYEPYRKLIESL